LYLMLWLKPVTAFSKVFAMPEARDRTSGAGAKQETRRNERHSGPRSALGEERAGKSPPEEKST
jgi:hypothetical protein